VIVPGSDQHTTSHVEMLVNIRIGIESLSNVPTRSYTLVQYAAYPPMTSAR
jgi:hypothetical protein